MVFPAVIGRLDLADISLLDQAVDLVGGVGREMRMKVANSLTVGLPSAWMVSMQKVSTVVKLASRS